MAKFRLADLFGTPKAADPEGELERQLQELEHQATDAVPGFGAQFLNRAGDLCIDAGRVDRGLYFLGRAIDMYLQAGRWDAAGAVCRKLLRVSPDAVRARCTLAWLSIGKGLGGDAQADIKDYIKAAQAAGLHLELTRKQLALMAEAVFDPDLLQLVAEELWELGDHEGARKVGLRMKAMVGGAGHVSDHDQERTWAAVLRAALMGPGEASS